VPDIRYARSKAILREIGYADDVIDRLVAEGRVLEKPRIEVKQCLI
jgi:hypothetical protein